MIELTLLEWIDNFAFTITLWALLLAAVGIFTYVCLPDDED